MPREPGGSEPKVNGDHSVPDSSPLQDLGLLQRELRDLVHDQLQLATLELRLATHSLMVMISTAVCVGALLMLAWLGLMAATGIGLTGLGFHPVMVLLAATALTLLLSILLYHFIGRRSRHLGFPSTLRTLKPRQPDELKSGES